MYDVRELWAWACAQMFDCLVTGVKYNVGSRCTMDGVVACASLLSRKKQAYNSLESRRNVELADA